MQTRARQLQEIGIPGYINCASLGRKSGRVFATGGLDNKVNIWAVGKSGCIMVLSDHTSPIQSLNFDYNENRLASGVISGAVKVWELEASKEVRTFSGHKSSTTSVEFHSRFSHNLVTGSIDCNIKLWDMRQKSCIYRYKGHTGEIRCLRFSPEGKWLVSGATDNTIKIWDITAGKMIKEFNNHSSEITDIQFHPNVLLMASASKDRTVNLYDVENFSLVNSSSRSNAAGPVQKLCFHPSGDILYAASTDCLKIYNTEPLEFLESVYVGWNNGFLDMAYSTSSKTHQIIGVASSQPNLLTYVVDVNQCAPFQTPNSQNIPKTQSSSSVRLIPADPPKPIVQQKYRDIPIREVPSEEAKIKILDGKNFKEVFHHEPTVPSSNNSPISEEPRKITEKINNKTEPTEKGDTRTNEETINDIAKIHGAVFNALVDRKEKLCFLKPRWSAISVSRIIDEATNSGDKSVFVDLLSVLLQNEKLLDFNVAFSLMPHLNKLSTHTHDHYVDVACQALKFILTQFSTLIKDNISVTPPKPNIHQEERRRKCQEVYENLRTIKKTLSVRQKINNGHSVLNEVVILLDLLVVE